jgi:LysM repeat protein
MSKCMKHKLKNLSVVSDSFTPPSEQIMNKKNRMTTLVLAITLGLGMPILASATNNPPPTVRADAPDTYIVKKGDTLWDISGKYLKDAWRWKEIWAVNPQVKNPHWIYPGDRLIICSIQGRTVVGVDEGDGCIGVERRMTASAGSSYNNVVRLSPQIHVEPLNAAIPAIPLKAIKSWLVDGNVVSEETLTKAPYVLAIDDRHVVAAAGEPVYVRGGRLVVGDAYGVYRQGAPFIDPETKEILGTEARLVARGTATALDKDVSTLQLTETVQQEVRAGDKVMAEEPSQDPGIFYPTNAENVVPGRLIRVMDGLDQAAINSTIAVNRGERDGVKVGQVFAIFRRGALVIDSHDGSQVRLPSERSGLAMVFRTFKKMSYAIILEGHGSIKVGDELRPPTGPTVDQ